MLEKLKEIIKKSAVRIVASLTAAGVSAYNYYAASNNAEFYHGCANEPTTCGTQEHFLEQLGSENLGYLAIAAGSVGTLAFVVASLNLLRLAQLKRGNTAETAPLMSSQFQSLNNMRGELKIWLLLSAALAATGWYGTYATFTHSAELRDQVNTDPFPPTDMTMMHHHGNMYSQAEWAFLALCITLVLYSGYAIAKASGVKFSDTISNTLHTWRQRRNDNMFVGHAITHDNSSVTLDTEEAQPLLINAAAEGDGEVEVKTSRFCVIL